MMLLMMRPFLAVLFCCCCVLFSPVEAQGLANVTIIPPPAALNITGLLPFNVTLDDKTLVSLPGLKYVVQKAVDEINTLRVILPNTTLNVTFYNTNATTTTSLAAVFAAQLDRSVGIIGPIYQDECLNSAMGSTVLTIPNIGPTTLVTSLTNRALYGFFTRMAPLPQLQSTVILDILDYFYRRSGQRQWREVSILSLTEETAILVASNMFFSAPDYNVDIKTFQQFLSVLSNPNFERNIDTPLQKIVDSKSRIVVALIDTFNMQEVLKISSRDPYNLVGKQRIWICWSSCSGKGVYLDYSNLNKPKVDKELLRLSSGLIGVSLPLGKGPRFLQLRDDYREETGLELENQAAVTFDAVYTLAYGIAATIRNGSLIVNGINVNPLLRFADFQGLTGRVFFNKTTGERFPYFDIVNFKTNTLDCPRCAGYAPDDFSRRVGSWIVNQSLEIGRSEIRNDPGIFPITFYDGTTNIPDLDVREPFDYWDCRDNEKKTDETGKRIDRETPDGDNPRYIDDKYICDQYIDCNNMMDEGYDCTPSYVIGFIIIGIIAGLFILADIFVYIPFIILFSLMGFRRISYSLETFQLEIAIFSIFGYGSIYSFFGQDHPVSCAFRPWLLGFGICGVIAAHVARLLRIWRATRSPIKIKIGPSIEHLFYSVIFFLPAVFLLFLWTLISTPTADIDTIDGDKHYVCVTGGFTGPPGGIVFFFILVGYEIILLLFGLFITFLIRKVPVRYSEKRVHTLSLFNLLFLCCVIITVVFILKAANQPFAAWIVLMLAILYGFTSTIMLHFVPKVVGIVYFDKLKRDVANKEISDMSSSMTATATQQH